MIIDSNIIVRLIVEDNPGQFRKVKTFFEKVESGQKNARVSILVLDEVIWVLTNYYGLSREIFLPKLIQLLTYPKIKIIEVKKELIIEILNKMRGDKIDFTDYYLAAIAKNTPIFSFDEDFKKLRF